MTPELKQQIEAMLIADGVHFSEISDTTEGDRVWVYGPGGGFWYQFGNQG